MCSIRGLGRSPGGGKWQSTPVFLPEKFHGQRSLAESMGLQRVWHEWATNTLFKYATSTCCRTVQKAGNFHAMSKGCQSLSKAIPTAEIITQLRVTWKPSRNQSALTKLCLPHGACFFSNLPYATLISNPFLLVCIWSQPSNFLPSFPAKHVKWLHLKYSRTSFEGSLQCQIWLHWMSNHSTSG